MRFTLKEYQSEAARKLLNALARSRDDWHTHKDRTAFALSSTTGSGKTVIAATVIEALLHGSDEFDFEADPTAVVLWVSKDPSLNEQTRGRFIECADRIPPGDLVLLDKNYAEESLQASTVYFINPDKLGARTDFVRHTDSRHVTFWEILNNTINDPGKTLYMILDEAHEGMKKPSDSEQTIVQRIINGNGANPPIPVVWGISATVKRFDDAMVQAKDRIKRPNVTIDPKDVQDSGLLKNSLTLDIPDEDGDFETIMIRDATLDFVDVCTRWAEYGERESLENSVLPLLVIQIPNKADGEKDSEKGQKEQDELIHRVLETVRKHWPEMPDNCIAHVLGDRAAIEIGAYTIPRVAPQDVEHNLRVRVLLAKDAVSTGWDCPRAEVLVSLRPGKDHTYVTQLLGRMVRTPLAQSTSEARLNSASCYLPRFNKETAKVVADEIMGRREPSSGPSGAAIPKVLLKPVMLRWNDEVPKDMRHLLETLPSFVKPTAVPRPIKRLLKASQAFAFDNLVPEADKIAHETLFDVLDGIVEKHSKDIEEATADILTANIRRIRVERGAESLGDETTQRAADAATVDDALRHLRRLLTASVVNRYLSRNMKAAINRAAEHGEDRNLIDILTIRARVAALGLIEAPDGEQNVQEAVEDAADALTRLWLTTKAREIAALKDIRQPTYEDIRGMAREPEARPIMIETEEQVDTVDTDRTLLPTARKHVLSDKEGNFPLDVKLNRWERTVIRRETQQDSLIGWYRNPSAAGKHALRITYKDGDSWKSVQPDLVFFNRSSDGACSPSIIDPHGAYQGDALPKLKALAWYADEYGDRFHRIISIGIEKEVSDQNVLYGIDMKDPKVRRAVYESEADAASVKALFEKHGSKYAAIPKT